MLRREDLEREIGNRWKSVLQSVLGLSDEEMSDKEPPCPTFLHQIVRFAVVKIALITRINLRREITFVEIVSLVMAGR